ncbi:hypothetical protein Pcinc_003544 [Petrolisthes cinctipes]|uniref:Uncharacterized protein n=1 Tax=Petrolisthes cinctipes TaxID=88211 RepID=A0AAE1L2D4_PETCI|nr:hypothetical protein Pcinc_003544 [Petrolisthes cinctipes]
MHQGASVGLMCSLVFCTWLSVGKFVRGGGLPTMMPLSTSGCYNNNTTTIDNITNTDNIISAITTSGCYNNTINTIANITSTIDNITSANITSGCYNTTTDINNTFLIDNTSLINNTITNTTYTANTTEYNLTSHTTENKM